MSHTLSPELRSLFKQPETTKVLVTTDEDGSPHVTFDDSLHVGEDGRLVYLEFEEYSQTNRNLTRSIWFSRKVAIQVLAKDGRRFQIRGVPWKALIAGPLYESYYRAGRAQKGDVGLSTVWLIPAQEITEETPAVREKRDNAGRLPLIHLDRLARSN